jgi:hypothetical protein
MIGLHQAIGAGIVFVLVSVWFGVATGVVVSLVVYFGLKAAIKGAAYKQQQDQRHD